MEAGEETADRAWPAWTLAKAQQRCQKRARQARLPKHEDEGNESAPFPRDFARLSHILYGHEGEADEKSESGSHAGASEHPSKDG